MREKEEGMKLWLIVSTVTLGLLAAAVIIGNQKRVDISARAVSPISAQSDSQPVQKRTPVIVELFTSEGCSSCPPADEVLARLERTQPVDGAEIITLGEHVDYWDYIGWSDPFSSPIFSERQGAYAEAFVLDGAYTPEMVVDGKVEFVGSNWDKAVAAISQAARAPKADVQIITARKNADAISLQMHVINLPAGTASETVDLLLAVTESDLLSNVLRGENAGRRLSHRTVVRQLGLIYSTEAKPGTSFSAESTVTLAKGWNAENLRAVAFAQERKSRRVIGAETVKLANRSMPNTRN
jgi:hypothetical protein